MLARAILISDPSRVKDQMVRKILEEVKLINDTKEKAIGDIGTVSTDPNDIASKLNTLISILKGE